MVPSLMKLRPPAQPIEPSEDDRGVVERQRLRLYREVFIKVLQNHYWDSIHDGIIGRKAKIFRILLDSTNAALDKCHLGLFDWDVVESRVLAEGGVTKDKHKIVLIDELLDNGKTMEDMKRHILDVLKDSHT